MNQTFLRLNDSALKSGLLQVYPGLAQEFKLVTETFSNLAKTASEGQFDGEEENEEGPSVVAPPHTSSPPETEVQNIGWGYSTKGKPTVSVFLVLCVGNKILHQAMEKCLTM